MPSFVHLDAAAKLRFWDKVQETEGCWEWIAAKAHFGHGQFWISARQTMVEASRVAWWIVNGPIPDGLCVLHRCDNPGCVRIDHLYIGTKKDNADDRSARKRHWVHRDPEKALAHLRRIAPLGKGGARA